MGYMGIKSFGANVVEAQAVDVLPDDMRSVDDYRIMVETVIDTGDALLMVSPFGGNAFTANFWNVPSGEVELDELPDNAALRIAREATNLRVELTEPAILGTRLVKTERNGKVSRRLIYTYAVGVRADVKGDALERFSLSRDYVGYQWLEHGSAEILERKFDSLDTSLRATVARFMGVSSDTAYGVIPTA